MKINFQKGTTLMETLVAVVFFVGVSMAIYGIFQKILIFTESIKVKTIAANLANEEFEIVRNLPYGSVGTSGGIPAGTIPQTQSLTRSGLTYTVETTIRNIDQAFDGVIGGVPNDTSPSDNKLVEVSLTCTLCRYHEPIVFTTTVAPKDLELTSTNGALFVQVFDASGHAIPQAQVHITNSAVNPTINLYDETDNDGMLQEVGVAPSSSYFVSATKEGYSTEQTYTSSQVSNGTPVKPYANVVAQAITQISFAIDELSTVNATSVNAECVPVAGFDFTMQGTKKIGTSPNTYKYNSSLLTNSSGALTLSNMEWDTYTLTPADTSYDLIGSNPLLQFDLAPGTTQSMQFVVAPKLARTLLVTVKDSSTNLPVSDATVTVAKGSTYSYTQTTGQGFVNQTDWSGGSGQANYTDLTKYFDGDGNISTTTTVGSALLRRVGSTYLSSGYLTSSTIDFGSTGVNYSEISFLPTNQPSQAGATSVRFQIASNNDNATWAYTGPDGTSSTYYTASSKTINAINDGNRYLRYRMFLSTSNTSYTPSVSDVNITFAASCTPPGQAAFQGLSSGTNTVTVSKTGYNSSSTNVSMSSNWIQTTVLLTH